ncbi:MAG TPA: hypothetical protein VD767_12110, partial [Thermomicrobiales bacterium]|nr:hypothetical protein [Thermomicrobiales bacterium]
MTHPEPFPTQSPWPGSQRAALAILIFVDAQANGTNHGAEEPGIDYAASGLQRLLGILADLDLPATTAWTPAAISLFPQLARNAIDAGHEFALAGPQTSQSDLGAATLSNLADAQVVGRVDYLSTAGWPEDDGPNDAGFTWRVTGVGGDAPIPTVIDELAPSVTIPVSPYWIDRTWLDPERPLPPSSLLEAWSLSLGEVRTEGGLMTIVLHPHIIGRPGFSGQLVRFLDEVIGTGDTWVATAAQIADWWLRDTTA